MKFLSNTTQISRSLCWLHSSLDGNMHTKSLGLYGDKMTALAHAPNFDEWLSDSIRERPAGFALIDDDMSAPSAPSSGACSGY